jgi:hypothetical protein
LERRSFAFEWELQLIITRPVQKIFEVALLVIVPVPRRAGLGVRWAAGIWSGGLRV